jgi:hypothetical protein
VKLAKPAFEELKASYRVDPASVHDCPRIYTKTDGIPDANTCAIRFSEALVIALGLIDSRKAIGDLGRGSSRLGASGNGKTRLLGPYGYKNLLCPHGIARGARDMAYFLKEQWGKPAEFARPREAPKDMIGKTGAVSFITIDGYSGQGHMDLWDKTAAVGAAYFDCAKCWFWQLD